MRKNYRDIWYFIVALLIVALMSLMMGCATNKAIQVPINNNSHIITEIKEVVKDSIVYVEVEKEVVREVVHNPKDTTSVLKTKYATSRADLKDGKLTHELKNNDNDSIPVKVVYKDVIKIDSVYVEREVPVEVRIEIPIRDNFFWISIIINVIVVCFIVFKIVRFFQ